MRGLVEEASTLASEERATRRTQECGCEDDTTAKLEEEEEEPVKKSPSIIKQ